MAASQLVLQVIGVGVAILGGQVLLPLLICTILFARGVRRNPLLVNMLLPWILYSVGVCFLMYTGHMDESTPPRGICYAQLAITLGALVMASAALLSYTISLYCSEPRREAGAEGGEISMRTTYLLCSIPLIGVSVYEVSLLHIFSSQWSELQVERDIMVCAIKHNHEVTRAAEAIAAGSTLVSVILTVDLLFRYGAGLKHVLHGQAGYRELVLAPMGPWKRVLIRLAIFEACCVFALLACLVLLSDPSRPVREAMWAFGDSVPLVAFFIFGTNSDIVDAWRFWRRAKPVNDDETQNPSNA